MEEKDYIKVIAPLLGKEYGPDIYEIEQGMVDRFVDAIKDPNPRWKKETPPTFPTALAPKKLLHELFTADIPLKRFLNGGNKYRYLEPIRVGDTIKVTSTLAGLRQVKGKNGPVIIMEVELEYVNQEGATAVKGKNTYLRY